MCVGGGGGVCACVSACMCEQACMCVHACTLMCVWGRGMHVFT